MVVIVVSIVPHSSIPYLPKVSHVRSASQRFNLGPHSQATPYLISSQEFFSEGTEH